MNTAFRLAVSPAGMRSIEAMMPAAPSSALWMRRFARTVARTYLLKRPEAVELAAAALALFGAASSPERSAIELLEPAKRPLQEGAGSRAGETGARHITFPRTDRP